VNILGNKLYLTPPFFFKKEISIQLVVCFFIRKMGNTDGVQALTDSRRLIKRGENSRFY
jgi:hypothetical protein